MGALPPDPRGIFDKKKGRAGARLSGAQAAELFSAEASLRPWPSYLIAMSRPRFIFLVLLALASGGLALFVVVDAVIHEALSRSVLYAVLPLVMLFAVAWSRLTDKPD